jgi:2,5-diamino-6-(ribosylamino)-4(3H)-pyrimidinone 5'-phosphate reductase
MTRPHVFINVAMTADGKIDTFERRGSPISSSQDNARVDQLRAESDAIVVGGRTLLDEDPRLTVKSEALRAGRVARGLPPNPAKVGVVSRADLEPGSAFLSIGPARVLVCTTARTPDDQVEWLRQQGAEVYLLGQERVDLVRMLDLLYEQGLRRLMVEGGSVLNFELMRLGLVDELMIYVAPLIFGGQSAPTLAGGLGLVRESALPLELLQVEKLDEGGVLLRYRFVR